MRILIISFFVLLTIPSFGQTSKTKTITINPQLSFQYYEHYKRLPLSSPNSSIEYLEGFDFAWGYTYVLSIKETKLKYELSDGTRYNYTFNKIISKTKMPDSTQFKLTLDANRYYNKLESSEPEMNTTIKQINDSTFLYFDKVEIEVPVYLREKFNVIRKGKSTKRGTFTFINDKRIRLISL